MTDLGAEEVLEEEILAAEGQIDKCIKRFAAVAGGNVRCLLNHQGISLSIAAIVLKRTGEVLTQEDSQTGILKDLILKTGIADHLKTVNNIIRSMLSLIKF